MNDYDDTPKTNPITEQIHRLRALRGYPRADDGKELERIARLNGTAADLRQAVEHILDEYDSCPSPAILRTEIANVEGRPKAGCSLCNYTGYRIVTRHMRTIDGILTDIDGAAPCSCRP